MSTSDMWGGGDSASAASATLTLDTGVVITVTGRAWLGRSPARPVGDETSELVAIDDPGMSLSKTHVAIDLTAGTLRLIDSGSTNGTCIRRGNAIVDVGTDAWVVVEPGDRVAIGDRWFDVTAPPAAVAGAPTLGYVPVAAPTACGVCGAGIAPGSRFCIECGAPVATAATAPVAPGAVPPPPAYDPAADDARPGRRQGGRSSGLIIGAVAAAVVVVLGLGWALFIRGDDGAGVAAADEPALVTDPEVRYEVDIDVPEFSSVRVVGSPDAVFVAAGSSGGEGFASAPATPEDSIVMRLDGRGEQVWEVDVDGRVTPYLVGGGVAVLSTADEERMLQFLDAGSGDTVWEIELDSSGDVEVIGGRLYVVTDDSVELLDLADGSTLERVRMSGPWGAIDAIWRFGVLIDHDVDDGEATVYSADLRELTDPIDVGDVNDVAYVGGELVVADGDDVVAYGDDGAERWSARSGLDVIHYMIPIGNDAMLLVADEVEAIELGDDGETLWSDDRSLHYVLDGRGYRAFALASEDEYSIVDSRTGDEMMSLDRDDVDFIWTADGGFVARDPDATAYALPSGERLWRLRCDESCWLLDGGYATGEVDGDELRIEVFG